MKTALYVSLIILLCSWSCVDNDYQHLPGKWNIIEIRSRGEKLNPPDTPYEVYMHFRPDGSFVLGRDEATIGKWKVSGDHLLMKQELVTDLNGRVVFPEIRNEWEIRLSENSMIWEGVARYNTQHLKLTLEREGSLEKLLSE